MIKLGDQWIENGRMYKAVKAKSKDPCKGCIYYDVWEEGACTNPKECVAVGVITIDLGPVNEDGVLAEERTGKFPEIANKFDLFAMDRVWVAEFQYSDSKGRHIQMQLRANSKQEAIDLWNRREATNEL